VPQRHPGQLAFVRPDTHPGREQQLLVVERLHDGPGRTGASEGGEQMTQRVLHAGVGIDHITRRRL